MTSIARQGFPNGTQRQPTTALEELSDQGTVVNREQRTNEVRERDGLNQPTYPHSGTHHRRLTSSSTSAA